MQFTIVQHLFQPCDGLVIQASLLSTESPRGLAYSVQDDEGEVKGTQWHMLFSINFHIFCFDGFANHSFLRFMFQCGQKTLNSAGIETGYFFDCYILTILDFSTFTSKKLNPKCIFCTICWNQNSSDHVGSYWLAKEEGREEGKNGERKKGKRPKTDIESVSQDIANLKTIVISNTSSILRTALEQSFLLIPSFGWTHVAQCRLHNVEQVTTL